MIGSISGMHIKYSHLKKITLEGLGRENEEIIGKWYRNFMGRDEGNVLAGRDVQNGVGLVMGLVELFEPLSEKCKVERVCSPIDDVTFIMHNEEAKEMLVNLSFGKGPKSTSRVIVVTEDILREITFKDKSHFLARRLTYGMQSRISSDKVYLDALRGVDEHFVTTKDTASTEATKSQQISDALDALRSVRSLYSQGTEQSKEQKKNL